jgi:hypothetical protein
LLREGGRPDDDLHVVLGQPDLQRILALLDEQVERRGRAVLEQLDASEEIARLASEARRHGATMSELTRHVRRMDKRRRELVPVTRQAIDTMLATFEQRRPPRTTRASRRARNADAEAGA